MSDAPVESDSPEVGRAFSPLRHLRWWTGRRATWSAFSGFCLVLAVFIVGIVALYHAQRLNSPSVSLFYCEHPTLSAMYWDSTWASTLDISPGPHFHTMMEESEPWVLDREHRVPDVAALRSLGVAIPKATLDLVLPSMFSYTQLRVGFPFRCFSGEHFGSSGTPTMNATHRFVVILPPTNVHGWVLIPYGPLPGLFYSWLFWSALAYLPLTGLSILRIRRRLSRGRCPRCAYDLAGASQCSECGTQVRETPCAVV